MAAVGLLSGLVLGSIYAVIATGLALIFGIVRLLNFSHGAVLMVGAYVAWASLFYLDIPYAVAFVVGLLGALSLGIIIELMVRTMRGKEGWFIGTFTVTFALAMFLEGIFRIIFTSTYRGLPPLIEGTLIILNFSTTYHRIIIAAIAVTVLISIWIFVRKTKFGIGMRAIAQDLDASQLMGINVKRIYMITLAMGSLLAGLAGILLGSVLFISPMVGTEPMLKAFVIVVFAGLGNIRGTLISAYIIGIVEAFAMLYIGVQWALPIIFLLMIVILAIRPSGLFGEEY